MSGVLLAGALTGLGLFTAANGSRRRPAPRAAVHEASLVGELAARLGPNAVRGAAMLRLHPARRHGCDLAVVGRTVEEHMARSLLAGLWLASLVILAGMGLTAGGFQIPVLWLAAAALVAAVGGPVLATLVLKAEATERRNELLVDLGAYADLVVLLLAAGSGIEGALTTAAESGDDWTWRQLRDVLRGARLTRKTPAEVLTELGRRLGVVELEEFGAAVALASSSGSRLRESLTARAEALRARELARVQAQAASATERMTFPVVALAMGFLVVLGFPALSKVLVGF